MMRLFSSRRESITADLRARAARFEQRYGRAPSQRELAQLAQASNFKTRNPKHGALDLAQAHAGWADKLARTLGVSLASVAPSVWHAATGRAAAHAPGAEAERLPELELARAAQKAVALAQQEKSTWTRADVIKYLGRVLPRTGLDPAAAAALLEDLADRALRSEFEPVTCLEAPEPAEVPRSLLRADGRSVYQRHGGIRYATRAQLVMEERMLAQARADNAPRLTRAQAAHALGAEPAQLDAALTGRADAAQDTRTRTGLRTDQAAAALSVLTDGTARIRHQRPGRLRQDPGADRHRPRLGRGGAGPGGGDHRVAVGPQHPGRRGPGLVQRRPVPGPPPRPPRRPRPGRDRPGAPAGHRRGLHDARPGPGRPDRLRPGPRREGDPGRGHRPAAGGGERRRHVPARRRPRLRPARRAGPVPQRLGTASQPAAARRGHHRAGRLRPARPHRRRGTGADDGRRRGRLRRAGRRWHRCAADGRRSRAAPGTVPPHPRRPDRPRRRRGRARGPHRRRRPGQRGRPDHLHPQRPHRRGGRTRPGAGQRGPAPRSRPSPRAGWSCAAPWTPTRRPGSGGGPTALSCIHISAMPNSGTRSPITSPWAGPCTPAWR